MDYIIDLHNVLRTKIIKGLINPFNLSKTPFFKIDKGRAEKKRIINGIGRKKKGRRRRRRRGNIMMEWNEWKRARERESQP